MDLTWEISLLMQRYEARVAKLDNMQYPQLIDERYLRGWNKIGGSPWRELQEQKLLD